MSKAKRSQAMTQTTISLEEALLKQIDARVSALRMSRSQYFCRLAENDLEESGDFVLKPMKQQDEPQTSGFELNERPAKKRGTA